MLSQIETYLLILVFVVSSVKGLAQDNSWSQFRGIGCKGIAPEGVTPPVKLDVNSNMAWKIPLSQGLSSPCIVGNRIFLTGFNPADSALITYCIDRNHGTLLWERKVYPDSLEKNHPLSNQAMATIAANKNAVFVYFGAYGILCYNPEGKLLWERKLPMPDTQYGSCSSPILYDSLLILNRLEFEHATILAINCSSGKTVWTSELKSPPGSLVNYHLSYATPVTWKDQLIIHRIFGLNSIFLKDGSEAWKIGLASSGVGTPVIDGDILYVNGFTNMGETMLFNKIPDFDTMLITYDTDKDSLVDISEIPEDWAFYRRPGLEEGQGLDSIYPIRKLATYFDTIPDNSLERDEWRKLKEYQESVMLEHGVVAFNLNGTKESTNPAQAWKVKEFVPEVPSVLVADGKVFTVMNGGLVSCIDAAKGTLIFRERLNAPGAYMASPLFAGGNIYFASYNGKITVIKPGDEMKIVAQSDLHEKILASSVALDDVLYIRTNNALYAFVNK